MITRILPGTIMALDEIAEQHATRRQKKIVDCGNALIGELSETMPEWQATKITAAIERLIEAYVVKP